MTKTDNITSHEGVTSWDVTNKSFGSLAFLANAEAKKTFVISKEAIASYARHAQMEIDPNSGNDVLNVILDAVGTEGSKVSSGEVDLTGGSEAGRGPYLAMGTVYTPPPEGKVLATLQETMEDSHYVVSAIVFQGEGSQEVLEKFDTLESTLIENFEGISCDMTVISEPNHTKTCSSFPQP